jgi:hypothetical protein
MSSVRNQLSDPFDLVAELRYSFPLGLVLLKPYLSPSLPVDITYLLASDGWNSCIRTLEGRQIHSEERYAETR